MKIRHAVALLLGSILSQHARADWFVDVGAGSHRIESRINGARVVDTSDSGIHIGAGGRRTINERSDIGVRLELDKIDSDLFLAVRALDYRRHPSERFAYGFFAGAARLDLATPAYGWYLGAGVAFRQLAGDWDLNLDVRFGDKVARDNLLPGEPSDRSPDNFHDVSGVTIYFSRSF